VSIVSPDADQRNPARMTQQDSSSTGESQIKTRAFQAVYLVSAGVATIGWTWLLGYCALTLFGY
jgi:hypothetical protein